MRVPASGPDNRGWDEHLGWDGVHLTSNASRVAARKLMVDLVRGGEEGEPASKRTRLESIVPAPAPAKKKGAAVGQPPTSPPRPVPPL